MSYWEPIATPSSHLEPPEAIEQWCEWCEKETTYCDCQTCEECGEHRPCIKVKIDDDSFWLCSEHRVIR
jgi:hypothetical protein